MKEEPRDLPPVACTALLAFPIRHHYECHAGCEVCLDDHTQLADFLYKVGGIPRSRVDALGDYRRWLDRHKIYAEGADGWGTRNTFDAANIRAYLREEWDCAAFDDANPTGQGMTHEIGKKV